MYTSIDLGSHSIKIVVSEKIGDKFCVLASTSVRSMGIKKGLIKDKELVLNSLKEAIDKINQQLGTPIKSVLLAFPLMSVSVSIESGEIAVDGVVTGEHIQELLKKTVGENIPKDLEIMYIEPIVFEVDSDVQVVDPRGLTTTKLEVKCAISTMEKSILYEYLEILSEAGLEVIDVTYGVVGDFYEIKSEENLKKLGVLVNIGYGKTEIAIFNKGILLKGTTIQTGSNKIDKDISYIYKIDRSVANNLKETFAAASDKYADSNDVVEAYNDSGDKININQLEISQIVEARLREILKSVKKEINYLTNREISYIMFTGGITNLTGFPYLLEEDFPYEKVLCNMTALGIRSNIYSTSYGQIKYFCQKMNFREISYTMFDKKEIDVLTKKKKKVSSTNNVIKTIETYLKN